MKLKEPPFNRDSFFHYKQYIEARDQWLNDYYKGKTVEFAHDLIGQSGRVTHEEGTAFEIEYVNCECFKLVGIEGTIFKTSAFKESE